MKIDFKELKKLKPSDRSDLLAQYQILQNERNGKITIFMLVAGISFLTSILIANILILFITSALATIIYIINTFLTWTSWERSANKLIDKYFEISAKNSGRKR